MEINKFIFRNYDIRGQVNNEELNEQSMELIGKAFGTYLLKKDIKEAVVGHDSRDYARKLKNALVIGLLQTGINVIDIGMCTTPCLYFAQHYHSVKGGAMVTASHNPNGWSGIKMSDDLSKTLKGDEIQEVYRIALQGEITEGSGSYKKNTNSKERYGKEIKERIKILRPLKIVINGGNAIAGKFAPEIFRKLGCKVVEQFCEIDNNFPHHEPDPENKKCKEYLAAKVNEVGADLGIAYDGDGDRIGIVDDKGRNVWSDKVMIFLSRQLLKKHPGAKIVYDVKCTQLLENEIKEKGGVPIMSKTGHSFIKTRLREEGAALAGERSGHIFYADNWYGFDDAIYSSARLVEFLAGTDKKMSELLDELPKVVNSPTHYVDCEDSKKFETVDKLVEDLREKGEKIIDIDGARVVYPDGFALVRASSTQPALVCVFEAGSEENLIKYKQGFKELFKKYPQISSKWGNE